MPNPNAINIDDPNWIRGFEEEPLEAELSPQLERELAEMKDRAKNAKLNPGLVEASEEIKEGNTNAVRKWQFNHQADFTEEAWNAGRIMWIGEFLCELQKIRPDAFYSEVSIRGLRGVGFVENGVPTYSGVGVANGNMPEWELLRTDEHGVPTTSKYRGWRTVLLACIKRGFITAEAVHKVFGRPVGERSRPWYRDIFTIQNGYCPECGQAACECKNRWDYLRAENYAYETPQEILQGKRQAVSPEPSRIICP